MMKCDCEERIGLEINSYNLFINLKDFFEQQEQEGLFLDIKVDEPYYLWRNGNREVAYYATKWYKCKCCGCLWEFEYPDFPQKGFVKKYKDGIYNGTQVIDSKIK
ncbi:hypothetical protein CSX00_09240 [Pseudobutyrivibrio ruminis]|uniref:Uncharacterized protein n=2 Tax=Pseudobutyrivibrio ruminis TaxID=46206 RepID=A0A2G3E917_9FIRM|nr:hypothetical protein CSX00_09240 [Pseudobutyrivibrio ruminis]